MKKKQTLKYDASLYSGDAIRKAISDYKTVAVCITMDRLNGCFELTFEADEKEIDTIVGEFSNYIIQIENCHGALA